MFSLTQSFEEGKDSNLLREVTPNTCPVITANPPVMKALKTQGSRISSRLVVLPLTNECESDLDQPAVDQALDAAGSNCQTWSNLGPG